MRILVTGHLGYIGTVLTPMLLVRGHDVVGMDADWFSRCTFGDPSQIAVVPNIHKDIREAVMSDLVGFDTVMHLAGLSNDPLGNYNPELTDEINHRASVRLGNLARQAGVRHFIFSSTCLNYDALGEQFIDETSPLAPGTPYARSKVDAETNLMRLNDRGFSVTVMRSATAFGYSPRIRWDLVLNNLTAHAATTGKIYIKSDGTPWRPVVHVEDISRAFVAVAEAPPDRVQNQAFNVGQTKENYQVSQLARIVAETVPGSRTVYAADASPDPRSYRVNCDMLPRLVKTYQPRWDARAAAAQLYGAIQNFGLAPEDFEGERYARLAHLRKLIADGILDERLNYTRCVTQAA